MLNEPESAKLRREEAAVISGILRKTNALAVLAVQFQREVVGYRGSNVSKGGLDGVCYVALNGIGKDDVEAAVLERQARVNGGCVVQPLAIYHRDGSKIGQKRVFNAPGLQ